ncbi:MAG TPA: 2-isopropylmalate synthase [Gemmatimonadaceae bacterium]|jgi:2-isopropylmalate synthase
MTPTHEGIDHAPVLIFDTTLRDGEQAPGCTMTPAEKLQVAGALARLGVDVIEAGFPAASPGDWQAVHEIAGRIGGRADAPVICALARATPRDIAQAASAILPARRRRIHTFIATSDLHIQHKLQSTRAEVLTRAAEMVRLARSLSDDVEFSPEDATRSDPVFLHEVLAAAVEAGATTLNIPDTVGFTTPEEYFALIASIREQVVRDRPIVLSTHCHDDLGLAVANSLAGVRAGARQVECTVNGLGERAGNAALEEVVMAIATRPTVYGAQTGIRCSEIGAASRIVSRCTGMRVPPNKAVVGANAFAHEAGIHQDGILKHRQTYEILDAAQLGLEGARLVLGKHSGRHALKRHLATLGYTLDAAEVEAVFARFKEVADRKKVVDDRELEAIVAGEIARATTGFALELVQVSCGTHAIPTATVRLKGPGGEALVAASEGDGPVDAVCRAIEECTGDRAELVEFSVDAAAEGTNAVGGVTIRLRERAAVASALAAAEGRESVPSAPPSLARVVTGFGVHTDIIVAAAEAYVSAVNALTRARLAASATPSPDALEVGA